MKVEEQWPELEGVWRKEWEPRKSGVIEGEWCPHYHCMMYAGTVTRENCGIWGKRLMRVWLEVLNSVVPDKAERVALHEKSWDWIENKKHLVCYCSKYMSKVQEAVTKDESIGRCYGVIGGPVVAEQVFRCLDPEDVVWFARLIRRKWKFAKRGLRKNVTKLRFWGIETRETLLDLLVAVWKVNGRFERIDCPF